MHTGAVEVATLGIFSAPRRIGQLARVLSSARAGARARPTVTSADDVLEEIGQASGRLENADNEGGGYLFRGTSEGYPGSPGAQAVESTPTSIDPGVACAYAVGAGCAANTPGQGIVQIFDRNNPNFDVTTSPMSLAQDFERILDIPPAEAARLADITIPESVALDILSDMGVSVPRRISGPTDLRRALDYVTEYARRPSLTP